MTRQGRIPPYHAMTNFQVKSLIAISLWVKVKIMHGEEVDVSSLTIQDVATLVQQEVCKDTPGTIAAPTKLKTKEGYPTWKRQMYLYLASKLTEDKLHMSYIVRPKTPPTEYADLMHELEFLIPNDGSTAASKRDSKAVYGILHSMIDCHTAKTRIRQSPTLKDGRTAWFDIEDLFEGKNNGEVKIREIRAFLEKQIYTGQGQGNAEKLTTRLLVYYDSLSDLKVPTSEADKLRHLRGKIQMGGSDFEPYYISTWMADVDRAIADHMDNDADVDYLHWTTRLINDESTYSKNSKKHSARISAASTGGRDYHDGNSGGSSGALQYNSSTGEPLDWCINGINITLFYGNIDKLDSQGKTLPKVTRDWFKSHKNKKCPQRFKDNAKEVTNSAKYKRKLQQKQRKIAAAAAARDGDDDAELCSASPN